MNSLSAFYFLTKFNIKKRILNTEKSFNIFNVGNWEYSLKWKPDSGILNADTLLYVFKENLVAKPHRH